MNDEKALATLRKRNEISKSNLPDELKKDLLEGIERPWSMPRGLEGIQAKHSNYLVNDAVDTDFDYVQHVIRCYEEVYEETSVRLAQWREFFEELSE